MNRTSKPPVARRFSDLHLLLGAVCALLAVGACTEDEAATTAVDLGPIGVEVVRVSGKPDEQGIAWVPADGASPLSLGCDLMLGVRVELPEATKYVLRPPKSCGSAKQCLFVKFAVLDGGDNELASVQGASTDGLIQLESATVGEVRSVQASLLRSSDGAPLLGPEGEPVVTEPVPLTLQGPSGCESGAGGQPAVGGAGGQPAAGGASGQAGEATGGVGSGGDASSAAGSPAASGAGGAAGGPSAGSTL